MAGIWRIRASSFVFGIVLIGCLLASCIARKKATGLGTVIGIDLGTTYSRVGVYLNGRVEIIANDQGDRVTPSWVGFTDNNERLIGEAAKNLSVVNPERAIFGVKTLIGRKFEDKEVQRYMELVPYRIFNKEGKPYIEVEINDGETNAFSPEEITAMLLTKMKETAEAYLGEEIKDAVLTVPAYFNDDQIQATKDAGTIAGLNVVRIVDEPMAAATAYGLDKECAEKYILVFDLSGRTFNVQIFAYNVIFHVLAKNGDARLGGKDFDQRIMEYFIRMIEKKHGKDISKDNRALGKLRRECERAKIALSSQHQVIVEVKALIDGMDFSEPLTRARFEELNDDLFKKTMEPLSKAMEEAGLEKKEIDEIVLVGGSTRIPIIQQLLKEYFDGKEPIKGVNPDEAVAYGAAELGGLMSAKVDDDEIKDIFFLPALSYSVGIETSGGAITKVVPKGSLLPIKVSQVFTTRHDQQTAVVIKVYMEVECLRKEFMLIDKFYLTGISPAPRGTPEIEITVEIISDFIYVKAEDKASGKFEDIVITSRASEEEAERMAKEGHEFALEVKETFVAGNKLDTRAYSMRNQTNGMDMLESDEKERIKTPSMKALQWMEAEVGRSSYKSQQ